MIHGTEVAVNITMDAENPGNDMLKPEIEGFISEIFGIPAESIIISMNESSSR